jgi:hypothetical protein
MLNFSVSFTDFQKIITSHYTHTKILLSDHINTITFLTDKFDDLNDVFLLSEPSNTQTHTQCTECLEDLFSILSQKERGGQND